METTGIILAGGKSSRMGTNKALLEIKGRRVIEHIVKELQCAVNKIIIVTNSFDEYEFLNLPMVKDKWVGMGPLAGIEAGLRASQTEKNLLVACDMPFISAKLGGILLQELNEYQAVVPEISGQLHPLFAAYRKDVQAEVQKSLELEQLRIRGIFRNIHVKIINEAELSKSGFQIKDADIFNMNHPDEYEQAKHMLTNESVEGRD